MKFDKVLVAGISLFALLMIACVFRLIRNEWVLDQRLHLIWNDYASYKKLPSYGTMLNEFWIWDINDFIRHEKVSK